MHLSDFRVKTDFWPLVSSNDELVIVQRNQVAVAPVLYICAHDDVTVTIKSAKNRDLLETASAAYTQAMPAGGKKKFDLPGTGSALDICTKVTVSGGSVFVGICSPDEFDAYFKQVTVSNL